MRIKNLTFNMIPNSLRHPTESGEYLVVTLYKSFHGGYDITDMTTMLYSKRHDMWNVIDTNDANTYTQITHDLILAWTPLKHIEDNLQPMLNEYNKEIFKAKLDKAQELEETIEEAKHEQ